MTDHPNHDDTSGQSKGRNRNAERQRRFYWRDKGKKQSVRVDLSKEYLDQLVDGRIRVEERDNPDILGTLIESIYGVEVSDKAIARLVARSWLSAADARNRKKVKEAIEAVIDCFALDTLKPEPIAPIATGTSTSS